MINLLIIEDQKIVRDAIVRNLNSSGEIKVIADSGDASRPAKCVKNIRLISF